MAGGRRGRRKTARSLRILPSSCLAFARAGNETTEEPGQGRGAFCETLAWRCLWRSVCSDQAITLKQPLGKLESFRPFFLRLKRHAASGITPLRNQAVLLPLQARELAKELEELRTELAGRIANIVAGDARSIASSDVGEASSIDLEKDAKVPPKADKWTRLPSGGAQPLLPLE